MADERLAAADFKCPAIALSGVVDYDMYKSFRAQFDKAAQSSVDISRHVEGEKIPFAISGER